MAKEDSGMFLAPIPVSSVTPVGTSMFYSWSVFVEVEPHHIWDIYASLAAVTDKMYNGILPEIALLESKTEITFRDFF